MNKLLIILLLPMLLSGQDISRSGYFNAHRGDSIGNNRTTLAKAQADCTGLAKTNYNNEDIWVTAPNRWSYSSPSIQFINLPTHIPTINNESIVVTKVTTTTAEVRIIMNIDNLNFSYIEFFNDGGEIQQTGRDKKLVFSKEELTSNTTYYFRVYIVLNDGKIKVSNTLTLKTL